MDDQYALYQASPRLIERQCGGWLAVTPAGWPLAVGVAGSTQEAAEAAFKAAMDRWSKIDLALTRQACGT